MIGHITIQFFAGKPRIVGSVGPYGASLHDGSEYTGSYAKYKTANQIRDWHISRITALVEGGVDMLALETIPCQLEAEVLVQLLKEFPEMKAWLSFSVSVSTFSQKSFCVSMLSSILLNELNPKIT